MNNEWIKKLINESSGAISSEKFSSPEILQENSSDLARELENVLIQKNGFFLLEGAIHVYSDQQMINVNSVYFKDKYDDLLNGVIFFAQDIFAVQFCIKDNQVFSFNPETGFFDFIAKDFKGWVELLFVDPTISGVNIARKWSDVEKGLEFDERLVPIQLFMFGGEYKINNLKPHSLKNAIEIYHGNWYAVKDIPDGKEIKIDSYVGLED